MHIFIFFWKLATGCVWKQSADMRHLYCCIWWWHANRVFTYHSFRKRETCHMYCLIIPWSSLFILNIYMALFIFDRQPDRQINCSHINMMHIYPSIRPTNYRYITLWQPTQMKVKESGDCWSSVVVEMSNRDLWPATEVTEVESKDSWCQTVVRMEEGRRKYSV